MDVIKVQPTDEPITLTNARDFIGISQATDTARDNVISANIIAARQWVESYTGIALMPQTWLTYSDYFYDKIDLKANVQSVTSVKYYDINGALQTLSSTIYYVDLVRARITLVNGKSWPDTYIQPNAVIIEYLCGYTSDESIPEAIKQGIRFLVAHWTKDQQSIESTRITTVPYAVQQLCDPYVDQRAWV